MHEPTLTVEQVTEAALRLSDKERAELSYRLLLSIDDIPVEDLLMSDEARDRLWQEELDRRLQQVAYGEVELIDGDVAMRRAREMLDDRDRERSMSSPDN
jgi:putative addiction module component